MKAYHPFKSILFILVGFSILISGCEKEPDPDPDSDIPKEILTINNWIWEGLNDFYLWEEFIPNMDPDFEEDPRAYFHKLLYKDDHDSWITDDYEELIAMFDGVQLATGMSVDARRIDETRVIGFIEYVTPNTPAADSGIARGDIIVTIDGKALTADNYFDLYYQTTATFGFADFDGINFVPNGRELTLTAQELNKNPFVHHEVIEYQGQKIGYYVYTNFVPGPADEWLAEINTVLGEFQEAGVSDIIVDLRYNGGGYGYVAEQMASALAPPSAVTNQSVFSRQIWNEGYTEYWKNADLDDDGKADGEESWQLVSRFPVSEVNLNLSRVYFLTTRNTASASELLMVGLYPYTEVIQIGTTTYGKCYGSITIDDWVNPRRHNWAMQPIVLKYANAVGYTDFVDGILPDHVVEEYLPELEPFGSIQDPILAKALEQITGVAPELKKSAATHRDFIKIPVPRKPLPEIKINWPDKPGSTVVY